jgi:hypothetical protein
MILKIPLVQESDYLTLKSICHKEVVGSDYKEYLTRIASRRASLREIGMEAEFVRMSAQPLLAHYDKNHKARWTDLMQFMRLNARNRRSAGRRQIDQSVR